MRTRKRYSAAQRAQLLARGLKRIEDLARGRVKGLATFPLETRHNGAMAADICSFKKARATPPQGYNEAMNITSPPLSAEDPTPEPSSSCRQALWYTHEIRENRAKSQKFHLDFLLGVERQVHERGFVSRKQTAALKRIYERYHMSADKDSIENSCEG